MVGRRILFHHLLDLTDESYRLNRSAVGARRKFFQRLEALTTNLYFETWERLMDFMMRGAGNRPLRRSKTLTPAVPEQNTP